MIEVILTAFHQVLKHACNLMFVHMFCLHVIFNVFLLLYHEIEMICSSYHLFAFLHFFNTLEEIIKQLCSWYWWDKCKLCTEFTGTL